MTVRQARNVAGITQADMAKRLKIHRSTYIKLEKDPGKMTIEQAQAISQVTGVPVDDIINDIPMYQVSDVARKIVANRVEP